MADETIPPYKAIDPEFTLEQMNKVIEEIKNGEFKVVDFRFGEENEILILPNPGGKPFTKPTGRTVKTLEVKLCNQVTE